MFTCTVLFDDAYTVLVGGNIFQNVSRGAKNATDTTNWGVF
jgi:hypothetical protein